MDAREQEELKFLAKHVGYFAVRLTSFGAEKKPWTIEVAPTLAAAKRFIMANRHLSLLANRIGSVEEANTHLFQIEKYDDWASD